MAAQFFAQSDGSEISRGVFYHQMFHITSEHKGADTGNGARDGFTGDLRGVVFS